jgi:hypothetical protein
VQQSLENGPVNVAASNLLIEISQDMGIPITCSQVQLLFLLEIVTLCLISL